MPPAKPYHFRPEEWQEPVTRAGYIGLQPLESECTPAAKARLELEVLESQRWEALRHPKGLLLKREA
jgi:hypothetical protein